MIDTVIENDQETLCVLGKEDKEESNTRLIINTEWLKKCVMRLGSYSRKGFKYLKNLCYIYFILSQEIY